MISRFFIDRPIFATVLSMVILLAGGVTLSSLPLAQYPDITPPTVQVVCSYPGANAQTVADTVAAPIEQQVNGVENMLYMSSQCTNDGAYTLTVTFKLGTDLKLALVQVQNRVQLAMPQMPDQVQQQGINIKKKTPNILLAVNLYSPDGRYDGLYLSNYLMIYIRDEILRLPGVSDVNILGERDYSIRGWLDPEKLAARNMTASDVVAAVQEENNQVVSGQLRPTAHRGRRAVPADPQRAGAAGRAVAVRRDHRQGRKNGARRARHAAGAAPRRRPAGTGRPAVRPIVPDGRAAVGRRWPSTKCRPPTRWIRPKASAGRWTS